MGAREGTLRKSSGLRRCEARRGPDWVAPGRRRNGSRSCRGIYRARIRLSPNWRGGGDVRDAEPRKRRGASERRIPRHTTTLASSSSWAPMALRMRGSREENV